MESAPRSLVLSRSAEEERRIQRDGLITAITQAINSVLCVLLGAVWFLAPQESALLPRGFAAVPLLAAACSSYAVVMQNRWRRINRKLRDLQLALTHEGVVYRSAAGTYSAPWSAVRQVRIRGRPGAQGGLAPYLVVDVADWGGPVCKLGKVGRLAVSLGGSGVAALQARQAVHLLSHGRVIATQR